MTDKELYVNRIVKKVIGAVKRKTARDVKNLIEEAFIHVYNQGYEAGKENK